MRAQPHRRWKHLARGLPPAAAVTLGFAGYEGLKEAFLPGLTKWQSHLLSIGVVALLSAVALAVFGHLRARQLAREARLAEAVRRGEAQYAALVRHAADVILVLGDAATIRFASPAATTLLGRAPAALLGATFAALAHPDDRPVALALVAGEAAWAADGRPILRLGHPGRAWRQFEAARTDLRHDPAVGGIVLNLRDVSEREWAEARLRRQLVLHETLLRAQSATGEGFLIVTERAAAIRYANDAFARICGYSAGELAALPSLLLLFAAAERPGLRDRLARGAGPPADGGQFTATLLRKDGATRELELAAAPLLAEERLDDRGPGRDGFVLIARDVTARRRAERALHAADERYRALVENAGDIIYRHDLDGTLRAINGAAARLTGYGRDEVVGQPLERFIAPGDWPTVAAALARAEELPPFAVRLVRKDGTFLPVEVNARLLVEEGQPAGFEGIARDLTGRLAEEERRADARFRALVRHASDAIVVYDARGTIRYLSPAVERLWGYRPVELLGTTGAALLHPDDRRALRRFRAALLAGGTASPTLTAGLRHADGSWRRVEGLGVNLLGDPDVGGVVVTLRDITARHRAEAALRESEGRHQALLAATPDTHIRFGRDGTYLDFRASDSYRRAMGVPPASRIGRHLREVHTPEFTAMSLDYIARTLATGRMQTYEYRLELPGGAVDYEARFVVVGPDEVLCVVREITEQRRAEASLREREAALHAAQRIAGLGSWTTDLDSGATTWSDELYRIFGVSPEAFVPTLDAFLPLIHPADRARVRDWIEGGERVGIVHRIAHPGGEERTVQGQYEILHDERGRATRVIGTLLDITEREAAAAALRASEARLRTVVGNAPVILYALDRDGTFTLSEGRGLAALDLAAGEVVGRSALEVYRDYPAIVADLRRALDGQAFTAISELGGRSFESAYAPLRDDDGRVAGVIGVSTDVTERRAFEARLLHQAFHDTLTGLPNRALFLDRLEHALARDARRGDRCAVLFLDLDRFKVVNDSLGHAAGDALLVAVAGRLRGCLRPEDTLARLGGDEFAVLLEGLGDAHEAARVAERIVAALARPFTIVAHEVYVATSIGIVLGDAGPADAADLLRDADTAMYRAKDGGGARHAIFDPSMNAAAAARLALETDLRRALEAGEFAVYYQPTVELTTGRLAGFEALVRWLHPQRGLVPPAEFIPLAEETGLILPLGRWVLEEACRQARRWRAEYPDAALTLGVNLSARQFQQPDLAAEVAGILAAAGLAPQHLRLEITESVVMADGDATGAMLGRLRDLGVSLAIDDFGTGHSSLAYLKRLPVDVLKVDRSFVMALGDDDGDDDEDAAIVRAIVTLAHTLGLAVTAEGIETAGQGDRLRELGCELGQGYHFARPLPAAAATALVAQSRPARVPVVAVA